MSSPRPAAGSSLGGFLDGECGFLREKLQSGEIPTPAQLGDFLRSLTAKSGPLVRDAPAEVATKMRDSLKGCGWDVGTNTSVGDDPPDPGVVLRALEETLSVLRASDSGGRRRSDERGGRRSRSPPRRRDRSRSPRRRRSRSRDRSRDRSRRRRSPSSSSSSSSRSRSRSPPKRRSGFSNQPPPGAAPELLAQSAMLQAMAGQGGISGGGGMPVNPMMAMMGSMGSMGGMSASAIMQNDKKSRELYVGNVPAGVTNEQLKEVLGGAMQQVGLNEAEGNPIIQCFMSGNFGFAEFRTAQEASNGMNLDKIFIGNSHLNVGRPSKYMGPATPYVTWGEFVTNKIKENPELAGQVIGMPPTAAALPDFSSTPANPMALAVSGQHKSVGEQATKALRELFVSLPNNCSEVQLTEFLTRQCHELGICQLDMERPVLSSRVNMVKSFAFCEFATVEICDGVFNKLNNAQMGTGNLRFGRPKAYEQLQAAGQIAAPGGFASPTAGDQPPAPPQMLEAPPTPCLRMTNMLSEDMLKDDEEYSEILEDIQEELSQFGKVLGIEIPRSGVGFLHAFVKFDSSDAAKAAKEVVEKRTFDGKQIGVEYFDPAKFDSKTFALV